MMIPTVHLNGTSRDALKGSYEEAYIALDNAYELLKHTAPNGRDYYPQGSSAISAATVEHMHRLSRIELVMKEIETIMEEIDKQEQ